jgi:hypothetical protein
MKFSASGKQKLVIWVTLAFIVLAFVVILLDWKDVKQVVGKADWYYMSC